MYSIYQAQQSVELVVFILERVLFYIILDLLI